MYLSIRDDIVFAARYGTLAEGLKDLDLPGIELFIRRDDTVTGLLSEGTDQRVHLNAPAEIDALASMAREMGIKISALCMDNNFNAGDKVAEEDWAVRAVGYASALGAPAVRIDAIMHGERAIALGERVSLVAGTIGRILKRTSGLTVDLGIENHGFQGNDPEFLRGLLDRVGSDRLGLTLDSGNFYWRGWPLSRVYAIFEHFAPYVKHTHVKNIAYPPDIREAQREIGFEYGRYVSPIQHGDIDHARYIETLRGAGYDRDICLEDESLGKYSPDERKHNLREAADYFRALIS